MKYAVLGMKLPFSREMPLVEDAFLLAKEAHAPQTRDSGLLYILHPLAVALVVVEDGRDPDGLGKGQHHRHLLHRVLRPLGRRTVPGAERDPRHRRGGRSLAPVAIPPSPFPHPPSHPRPTGCHLPRRGCGCRVCGGCRRLFRHRPRGSGNGCGCRRR